MASKTVVGQDEWTKARLELLQKEKELTKLKDEVAKARRAMPCHKVETDYVFKDVNGKEAKLSSFFDGFQNGKKSLILVHFMYDPSWDAACKSCSFWADSYDGVLPHFLQKANFIVVAKAPPEKLKALQEKKGWKFPMYSSFDTTFNVDYGVEFTQEEIDAKDASVRKYNYTAKPGASQSPGWSVFSKDDSGVYHTYSCYARGLDNLNAAYNWMDLLPDGRQEEGLGFTMAWVKHKEDYGQ
eukprot:TRINITY_DN75579_c0_g1_i1.p1 TRINITY_DN75579_c0_g1~~TRINITY_DN75579_c0_g1_i1.p1  ORF type:complete len:241 (+),score=40.06 TRINITY_DN75579_c0_g1_i1:67-789(+)